MDSKQHRSVQCPGCAVPRSKHTDIYVKPRIPHAKQRDGRNGFTNKLTVKRPGGIGAFLQQDAERVMTKTEAGSQPTPSTPAA